MNDSTMKLTYNVQLIPTLAKYRGREVEIIDVDDELIINKVEIQVENGRIKKVLLDNECRHPNCNPWNGEFCLPYNIKGGKWNDTIAERLIDTLKTYHLDDCYDIPRELFRPKEPLF